MIWKAGGVSEITGVEDVEGVFGEGGIGRIAEIEVACVFRVFLVDAFVLFVSWPERCSIE